MDNEPDKNKTAGMAMSVSLNDVEAMHAIARHWLSDLVFFNDEMNFFRKIFDKYLFSMVDEVNIDWTRTMVDELMRQEMRRLKLEEDINNHCTHLAQGSLQYRPGEVNRWKDEHATLETSFAIYVSDFKRMKKGIFDLTERVMHAGLPSRSRDFDVKG